MSTADQAIATQIVNIQAKTGKTLDELGALLKGSGHTKHGALRTFAQEHFGLGFGDANTRCTSSFAATGHRRRGARAFH